MLQPQQQSLWDLPQPAHETTSPLRSARSGSFVDNMRLPVHRWFRYSAGFSAQWAEELIRERSPTLVLDPFAGSGTTLVAAQAAGARACGFESHPFVARIAAAKTRWNQDDAAFAVAAESLLATAAKRAPANLDDCPDLLRKCYTPDVLLELFAIRDTYLERADSMPDDTAGLLWLAITAVLRACSHVGTAQWQYVLPSKRKARQVRPTVAFAEKVADVLDDIRFARNGRWRDDAEVLLHDARDRVPEELLSAVDLVITSPPYPNNYDYADATRLEMTFWGEVRGWGDLQGAVRKYIIRSCSQHATAERLELPQLLSEPLLAPIRDELTLVCGQLADVRLTKGGKKAYHTMIAAYFGDLAKVFRSLRDACVEGCSMCLVVGDSAPYGVYVPAETWLGQLALATGFQSYRFEKLRDRNVKWKNRKHRVPLHEGRLWIQG